MTAAHWMRGAALALVVGLPACHSGPEVCRPEGYPRYFGERAGRMAQGIANIPEWWSDELDYRGQQHAAWAARKSKRIGQEVDTTLREGYPNVVADARSHAPSLGQTIGSWWDKLGEDTRCVLDRTWYDLLILD